MPRLSGSIHRSGGVLGDLRVEQPAPRILNHDIMGCTAEGVTGNRLYSGRALAMTEPGDVIQLHPDLRSQWSFISAHYDRIGLSFTDQVIWDVGPQELARHPNREVSVFFFGGDEQAARPNRPWFGVVEYINSKNNFMASAQELGVPVPDTRCYGEVSRIDEAELATLPFPCYLKAAVSVSGAGIYRCVDAEELRLAKGLFAPGIPVQVQAEVISDCFLNLQYQVSSRGLTRLAATEQVLEGPAHQGNRYPARAEPWECVEPMAQWLYRQGMQGVFAFDVAVVEWQGATEYLAIECNPRFNGASYPTAVAQKLGVEQWVAKNFRTEHRTLADVDLIGIEYDSTTKQGVVLVNWGPVLAGKLMILLAGPLHVQDYLARELQERLR